MIDHQFILFGMKKKTKGPCMGAHVLIILLNKLGKEIKCEVCAAIYRCFATDKTNNT